MPGMDPAHQVHFEEIDRTLRPEWRSRRRKKKRGLQPRARVPEGMDIVEAAEGTCGGDDAVAQTCGVTRHGGHRIGNANPVAERRRRRTGPRPGTSLAFPIAWGDAASLTIVRVFWPEANCVGINVGP
jgi:hypothetical protein